MTSDGSTDLTREEAHDGYLKNLYAWQAALPRQTLANAALPMPELIPPQFAQGPVQHTCQRYGTLNVLLFWEATQPALYKLGPAAFRNILRRSVTLSMGKFFSRAYLMPSGPHAFWGSFRNFFIASCGSRSSHLRACCTASHRSLSLSLSFSPLAIGLFILS